MLNRQGKILEVETLQLTSSTKNQYKFLDYLKPGAVFYFVEIDLDTLVSESSKKAFSNKLNNRSRIRDTKRTEENHYESLAKKL